MSFTELDAKTALLVVDLQKGAAGKLSARKDSPAACPRRLHMSSDRVMITLSVKAGAASDFTGHAKGPSQA
jgi:hypothetical protein